MERPELDKNISVQDFKDFYWRKEELVRFCRHTGLNTTGSKTDLSERILLFLSNGIIPPTLKFRAAKPQSRFDWSTAALNGTVLITDNYKNTENVRAFFTKEIGKHFSFNVKFMSWMKENTGKTLQDAVQEWKHLHELKKGESSTTAIAPQFEYNRYIRAFLAGNPGLTARDAMRFWKLKSAKRVPHEYEQEDLELK